MTDRISEIALQAAKDYIAERGGEISRTGTMSVITVEFIEAFMAAIAHAVLSLPR